MQQLITKKFGVILISLFILFNISSIKANNTSITKTSIYQASNNWTLVKEENGIKVYVSSYEWADGALKLKVKFENTNANDKNISFDISSNTSPNDVRTYQVLVKGNSFTEFLDEESPIEIGVGQSEKDFTINIK